MMEMDPNEVFQMGFRYGLLQRKYQIAIEALQEKAKLEPGPRMYENCAAGIALAEIARIDSEVTTGSEPGEK